MAKIGIRKIAGRLFHLIMKFPLVLRTAHFVAFYTEIATRSQAIKKMTNKMSRSGSFEVLYPFRITYHLNVFFRNHVFTIGRNQIF